jgi:S1-C subfamily serine protease
MSTKMRNLLIIGAMLLISALALSAVAAQEATPTVEPPAAETLVVPEVGTVESDPAARPFLGVLLEDSDNGVTIARVVDGSAAAAAGLQEGDVINGVNGASVATVEEATSAIGALSIGDEVTIDITRDGAAQSITATLGAQPEDQPPFAIPFGQGRGGRDRMFGFEFNDADQSWTITGLSEDSPLHAAGLREGDVITSVDGETYDPVGLLQYVASLGEDATVTLSITRDGAAQDVTVPASDLIMAVGFGGMGGFFGRGEGEGIPFNFGNGEEVPFDFGQMMPMFRSAYGNGYLGVVFQPLDASIAEENSLRVNEGALISEVVASSPAETAGLLANDVVTAVNGEAVDEEHTLRDRLIAYEPEDVVTLSVLRDDETQEIQVTLGEPQMPEMRFFNMPFEGRGGFPFGDRGRQPDATAEAVPNV